ncbi:hypothetical protein F2Q69_00020989 [Brassica cretica]|uniref:F-box domain-containing protein n=1 Tax=Brassica cretica TaxID=69181 RepID=A0A8S9QGK6_BRACR|nr:hypothetical protein F2Q69_00020989 [Brassica cretica]
MDGTTVFLRRDHRSEALGSLSVLQDETICVLLEYLDPRYIAYLSCVSMYFYIDYESIEYRILNLNV